MQQSDRQVSHVPITTWELLKGYWQSSAKWVPWLFLSSVMVLTISLVMLDVVFTTWYNHFYDALQEYSWRRAYDLLIIFLFIAAVYIVIAVYRYYLQSFLALRWRRWLTEKIIGRWLFHRNYYYLEDFSGGTDNPDQRIQEDINSLVTISLSLLIGFLSAAVTFFAFIFILWELSGSIIYLPWTDHVLHVRGYLVWIAVIYAVIGTWLTFRIGRPLPQLNFEQQRREANFRFAAVDLRVHAEHVAFYRGENQQRNSLIKVFSSALDNWYQIILRQKLLLWFTNGYNQISVLLPLVVALPNYFNKVFRLGGLMQTLAAFSRIQDALSFIVNSFTVIAEWRAVVRRLLTFLNHMQTIEDGAVTHNHFVYKKINENKIITNNVTVKTSDGKSLLAGICQEFVGGKHTWIRGNSGIGKSTFIRAIAEIWPFGEGEISLPADKKIMYIPQRSYMPLGTLKEALLFPYNSDFSVKNEVLVDLLNACDLPRLTTQLDHVIVWSEHLSPGELQRIAFVRVLLHAPDWVFLDESTSALDLSHEKKLYDLLKEKLPHCSIISVGHRSSLGDYHDRIADFTPYIVES